MSNRRPTPMMKQFQSGTPSHSSAAEHAQSSVKGKLDEAAPLSGETPDDPTGAVAFGKAKLALLTNLKSRKR